MIPYTANIEKLTLANTDFRHVLYTSAHMQIVLMSLKPGQDIGMEVHHVDQFFRFESGKGKSIINGKEYPVSDGSVILVPTGSEHNVINTGDEPLKLYTVYAPPNHIEGRVHKTKTAAEKDAEDEEFAPK
ncbi:MAG: uncharacterized protein JWO00_50 [Candidatus Parcubacteria bacterium]|nr:uncharacterized protein [Candidatus Parcubacteria bacterium]